jgi:hypothetical protein
MAVCSSLSLGLQEAFAYFVSVFSHGYFRSYTTDAPPLHYTFSAGYFYEDKLLSKTLTAHVGIELVSPGGAK